MFLRHLSALRSELSSGVSSVAHRALNTFGVLALLGDKQLAKGSLEL